MGQGNRVLTWKLLAAILKRAVGTTDCTSRFHSSCPPGSKPATRLTPALPLLLFLPGLQGTNWVNLRHIHDGAHGLQSGTAAFANLLSGERLVCLCATAQHYISNWEATVGQTNPLTQQDSSKAAWASKLDEFQAHRMSRKSLDYREKARKESIPRQHTGKKSLLLPLPPTRTQGQMAKPHCLPLRSHKLPLACHQTSYRLSFSG